MFYFVFEYWAILATQGNRIFDMGLTTSLTLKNSSTCKYFLLETALKVNKWPIYYQIWLGHYTRVERDIYAFICMQRYSLIDGKI